MDSIKLSKAEQLQLAKNNRNSEGTNWTKTSDYPNDEVSFSGRKSDSKKSILGIGAAIVSLVTLGVELIKNKGANISSFWQELFGKAGKIVKEPPKVKPDVVEDVKEKAQRDLDSLIQRVKKECSDADIEIEDGTGTLAYKDGDSYKMLVYENNELIAKAENNAGECTFKRIVNGQEQDVLEDAFYQLESRLKLKKIATGARTDLAGTIYESQSKLFKTIKKGEIEPLGTKTVEEIEAKFQKFADENGFVLHKEGDSFSIIDGNGNTLRECHQGFWDGQWYDRHIMYDKDGNELSHFILKHDGSFSSIVEFHYDESGKLLFSNGVGLRDGANVRVRQPNGKTEILPPEDFRQKYGVEATYYGEFNK